MARTSVTERQSQGGRQSSNTLHSHFTRVQGHLFVFLLSNVTVFCDYQSQLLRTRKVSLIVNNFNLKQNPTLSKPHLTFRNRKLQPFSSFSPEFFGGLLFPKTITHETFRYKCPQNSNFTLVSQAYKETSFTGVTATIRKMATFPTCILN